MPGKAATHKPIRCIRTWGGVKFTLEYAWDNRLGDIYIEGARYNPVDCMQVHDYEWEGGTLTIREKKEIAASFEEWLLENGATYINELSYL